MNTSKFARPFACINLDVFSTWEPYENLKGVSKMLEKFDGEDPLSSSTSSEEDENWCTLDLNDDD